MPRKPNPKHFMTKATGDNAGKLFDKMRKQLGNVQVMGTKPGVNATLTVGGRAYTGTGKSLRAALMKALKAWKASN